MVFSQRGFHSTRSSVQSSAYNLKYMVRRVGLSFVIVPDWLLTCWLLTCWFLTLPAPLRAAQHKETSSHSFDVDPGEPRYFEMPAKEANARLHVQYQVQWPQKTRGVHVLVESEEQFQHFRKNRPHREIASLDYQKEGTLDVHLPSPGLYMVVVESAEVRLRCRVEMDLTLTTGPEPETLPVSYVPPRTRLIVVSTSLAGFALILIFSGRALWRATRHRPEYY